MKMVRETQRNCDRENILILLWRDELVGRTAGFLRVMKILDSKLSSILFSKTTPLQYSRQGRMEN